MVNLNQISSEYWGKPESIGTAKAWVAQHLQMWGFKGGIGMPIAAGDAKVMLN